MNDPWREQLRAVLLEALALKDLPRSGWVRAGVSQPESVAAHSWGVAFLALVLMPPELDRARVLEIALLHDLAEVRVGDITPHDAVDAGEKSRAEREALSALLAPLGRGDVLFERWLEYEVGSTAEGRFVKACDKLDMALQAERYAEQGLDLSEFVRSALGRLEGHVLSDLVHVASDRDVHQQAEGEHDGDHGGAAVGDERQSDPNHGHDA